MNRMMSRLSPCSPRQFAGGLRKSSARNAHRCLLGPISLILLLVAGASVGCRSSRPPSACARPWDFALIGDIPYTDPAVTNDFPNLIWQLNRADVDFVIHDGDIKAGAAPCTDELLAARLAQFQTIRHPLFFVPGDNEWSDCNKTAEPKRDPLEALQKLRALFCAGNQSLGQRTLPLHRQSDGGDAQFAEFRENIRWERGGIVFAGFNLPGGANNFGKAEFPLRNQANLAWMRETFTAAMRQKSLGVVLVIQANPHYDLPRTNQTRLGFNEFLDALEKETVAFGRPVVLVHGDSHYFRIDQPMVSARSRRRVEHFTRVETFGNPDAHWVRVTVDAHDPNLFRFRPEYVRQNFIDHRKPAEATKNN